MKNKLGDLNDHLFAQLERLSDENMDPKEMAQEVRRAKAIVGVSDQIVENATLKIRAAKLFADHGEKILPMLPQIGKSEREPALKVIDGAKEK